MVLVSFMIYYCLASLGHNQAFNLEFYKILLYWDQNKLIIHSSLSIRYMYALVYALGTENLYPHERDHKWKDILGYTSFTHVQSNLKMIS